MAETSDSYNASIEFNFDSLKHTVQTEASFFYNKGENVIEYVHVPDSGDIYYVIDNIDYRETLGGRLNINYNFYPRFTLKTGFSVTGVSQTLTFTDSTVTPTDTSYFENTFLTDFQYTKDFNINLSYNLYQYDLLFSVFYKYNGKTTALYTDADSESGEVVSQYIVNPYHTLDFTVTKNFYNKRLTMVVGAKNLFNNKEIQTTSGYNPETTHGGGSAGSRAVGWGRTMFVKLSYKFIK